ncbi:MAG TPA: PH domain-containing protein [Acidimicrobiales bacterium]|nr:PH domain-containing protein [Acidimicrobiales bacterium]
MPFPRRLLTEDEEVVVEIRPHWAFLGRPLVVAVGVVTLSIAVMVVFAKAPPAVLYILLILVACSALWLVARLIRWFATSLVVTTTRIVQRSGVFGRTGLELRLERVNQLSYHQSISDRILRTGELHVEMGGETGVVVFDRVPRPAAVQSIITEQIDALRHRSVAPVASGLGGSAPAGSGLGGLGPVGSWHEDGATRPPPRNGVALSDETPPSGTARVPHPPHGEETVADRLMQLDELRRRGIVTDEEFASKKAELLDRL